MKRRTVLIVALMMLSVAGFTQTKKKKPSTPAIFAAAKYAYVKADAGDMYDPRLLPEDRDAISNVMKALQAWGRYVVMPTADGADLVFIVRKGRLGSAQVGGTVGTTATPPYGSPRPNPMGAPGVTAGGEVGPPDDFMEVCIKQPDGTLSGPVWERTRPDGLDAPGVPLLKQIKDAVDRDYPQK